MGTIRLTPHLQGLEPQPDWDPARVVRQPASGGRIVSCLWHAGMCYVVCGSPHRRLMGTIRLTHHLQGLELQPDWDPARVVRQPARGEIPVSCLWHAVMCHIVCASPHRRLMGTMRLTPHFQVLAPQQDCDPGRVIWQPASGEIHVSCLWHAGTCHVMCASPHRRLMDTIRLTPHLQGLAQQPDCYPT